MKHIGKHNSKRVVVLFREVPNDEHMCLVAYPDLLPRLVHDEVMRVIESAPGQAAENFADALWRNVMADGRNVLETMHRESFIKKVPTNQVIMTPTAKSNVRLDELNSILNEMKQGEEAIKRLSELDAGAGISGKTGRKTPAEPREVGAPRNSRATPAQVPESAVDVLSGADLADQLLTQAEKMKSSAAQLLAEAERLSAEAASMLPTPKANVKSKKTTTKVKAD